ncbi:Uncharacterized protein SCF082_LOCUS15419, partial [Durusdinium trenchii]
VEQATLIAWKERAEHHDTPRGERLVGSPSPRSRPLISPLERFSPCPLDVQPHSPKQSHAPRQAIPELQRVMTLDAVPSLPRPKTAAQVPKSEIRSVKQWLRVVMPKVNAQERETDEAEAPEVPARNVRPVRKGAENPVDPEIGAERPFRIETCHGETVRKQRPQFDGRTCELRFLRFGETNGAMSKESLDEGLKLLWMNASASCEPMDALIQEGVAALNGCAVRLNWPLTEQLRRWCTRLALREEVWLEFTLGSLRAECLLLADTMLTMHAGFVAVVGWNYFDRLWPLWEWAVFCARRGAHRVQLAADAFCKKTVVEYHRALRRLSVVNASCRDTRDRPLLLEALEKLFHCPAGMDIVGFKTGDSESGPTVVKERMVDFSRVERFVRVTAIAVFAREAALANSRHLEKSDEMGWTALAEEFGYDDLWNALKKCKPWDWLDVVQTEDPEATDLAYEATVEAWWEDTVVPELERERQLALLP